MNHEITLTQNDKKQIYGFVDRGKFGDCYHDIYLDLLGSLVSVKYSKAFALKFPIVVYDKHYHFKGNERRIEDGADRNDDSKMVFVYFAHPIPLSPLYFATLSNRMILPLARAASIIGAKCDSTSISGAPLTVRVDMVQFADIWDNHKKDILGRCKGILALNNDTIRSSRLQYASNTINCIDNLFDVNTI
jgi:hypothetical protein